MESTIAFISGILVAIVIAIILIKVCNKNGKYRTDYDERQEAIRGKGYKYAMYTAWVMIAIFIVAFEGGIDIHMEKSFVLSLILFVSISVQVLHAVWNDAYWGRNNDIKKHVWTFVILTAFNAMGFVGMLMDNRVYVDGKITFNAINAEAALVFLAMGVELIIKNRFKKSEEEDEE